MSDQEQELYMAMGISELESEITTLKADLAAAMKVVEAAKQLNAAMNLSMDVKTYKCILDKTLTAYDKAKP